MVSANAIVMNAYGGPGVLQPQVVDLGRVGVGHALLRVLAVAVNHLDVDIREGTSRMSLELPHVLGREVVGEVEEVGAAVTNVQVGGRYAVLPNSPCRQCERCLTGRANLCRYAYMPGITGWGGYAERMLIPAQALVPLGALSPEVAAATPISFGTAWRMLYTAGQLQPGETVLVAGAAGGLGHAAVQLAKFGGARVVGLVGDPAKAEFAEACGADAVVSTREAHWPELARKAAGGDGFDVVVEHVGGELFESVVSLLRPAGRLLVGGGHAGEHPRLDVITTFREELRLIGVRSQRPDEIQRVLDLAADGHIHPHIDRTLPLPAAPEAHEALTQRRVRGKQVLIP